MRRTMASGGVDSPIPIDPEVGLTAGEVDERRRAGLTNDVPDAPVRTLGEIVRANVFTPVNAIMGTLLALILIAGYPQDALFAGVIISNSVIGIVQELRARHTLHALELLNAPKAVVRRDGREVELPVSQVVADDLLIARPGDQIVVDGRVVSAVGFDVDESLLTGESDPVSKAVDDLVMSGSFVVAGLGLIPRHRRRRRAYANSSPRRPRVFKLVHSELRRGINTILRWLTFIIPPAPGSCCCRLAALERETDLAGGTPGHGRRRGGDGARRAGAADQPRVRGRRHRARPPPGAGEGAGHGRAAGARRHPLPRQDRHDHHRRDLLRRRSPSATPTTTSRRAGAMAHGDPNPNPTMAAIATGAPAPDGMGGPCDDRAVQLGPQVVGACFATGARTTSVRPTSSSTRRRRRAHWPRSPARRAGPPRAGAVARARRAPRGTSCPMPPTPRRAGPARGHRAPDAPEILAYFAEQGVRSRSSRATTSATVAAVAQRAGVPNADAFIDARELPDDPEARRARSRDGGVRAGHPAPEAGDGRGAAGVKGRSSR
jgi:cation-transporting P-type ATPase E